MHKRLQKKEREVGDQSKDDGATLLCPSFNSRVQPSRRETERAVRRMYDFCVKRKLPEVWVYLWEKPVSQRSLGALG